jgi:2Fe-2S iron-sulfur cluster binding domain
VRIDMKKRVSISSPCILRRTTQLSMAAEPRNLDSPKAPYHAYHAYHALFPSAALCRYERCYLRSRLPGPCAAQISTRFSISLGEGKPCFQRILWPVPAQEGGPRNAAPRKGHFAAQNLCFATRHEAGKVQAEVMCSGEGHFMAVSFTPNRKQITLDVTPGEPLLWAIRESAGLTGTKFGWGIAQCGACTVHLNRSVSHGTVT